MSRFLLLSVFLVTTLAALPTARMALPPDFEAQSTHIEIDGFGGHNKGSYEFVDKLGQAYSGEFSRAESRLGILDPLVVRSRATGSFSFVDSTAETSMSAACDMRKVTVNLDVVTLDPKKMAYHCEFHGDNALMAARLVIGQPKRQGFKEKMLAQDLRRGEAAMFGQNLVIESVHNYRDSKFGSQPPVGYLLKSGDRTVAAVELTDVDPGLYIVDDISDDLRRTIYVTALAIGVFRDPANSALEPD